jgi:hypothetical protein
MAKASRAFSKAKLNWPQLVSLPVGRLYETSKTLVTTRPNAFLLVAIVDQATGKLWRFWLMPFSDLRSIASENRGHLIVTPSPSMRSGDRYTTWRCEDVREVAARLANEADRTD